MATWTQLRGVLFNRISSKRTSWGSISTLGKGHSSSDGTEVSPSFLNICNLPKKQQKQKSLPSPGARKLLSCGNQVENMVSKNDTSQVWRKLVDHIIAAHATSLAGLSLTFWCWHFGLWGALLCPGNASIHGCKPPFLSP